jgi:deoxyribonuclease-4
MGKRPKSAKKTAAPPAHFESEQQACNPLVGAHVSIARGVHLAFSRGEALGCRVIQIFTKNASQWKSPRLTEEIISKFIEESRRTGIPVMAHDAYLINLAAPDRALREKSQAALVEEMERAERLHIPHLVMHPGAHKDAGEDAGIEEVIRSFNVVFEQTSGFGVKVLVENTAGQGTALGYCFEHLKRIVENVSEPDRIGVCLDTCHAFTAGYDLRSEASYEHVLHDFDSMLGLDRIEALHVNDSKKGLGSRVDRHEHIGLGKLGLECFRLIMNDPRFVHVPKILETPKELAGRDMDPVNLKTLKDLVRQGKPCSRKPKP